jgi:hypothetical protein
MLRIFHGPPALWMMQPTRVVALARRMSTDDIYRYFKRALEQAKSGK